MQCDRIKSNPRLLVAGLLASALLFLPACGKGGEPSGPCVDCGAESGQLRVTDPSARACETLVEAAGGRVVSVEFGAGSQGKSVQEGDRAGISVVSTTGAPLPETVGTIRFDGALKVLQSTCYGADGEALVGDGVKL